MWSHALGLICWGRQFNSVWRYHHTTGLVQRQDVSLSKTRPGFDSLIRCQPPFCRHMWSHALGLICWGRQFNSVWRYHHSTGLVQRQDVSLSKTRPGFDSLIRCQPPFCRHMWSHALGLICWGRQFNSVWRYHHSTGLVQRQDVSLSKTRPGFDSLIRCQPPFCRHMWSHALGLICWGRQFNSVWRYHHSTGLVQRQDVSLSKTRPGFDSLIRCQPPFCRHMWSHALGLICWGRQFNSVWRYHHSTGLVQRQDVSLSKTMSLSKTRPGFDSLIQSRQTLFFLGCSVMATPVLWKYLL